MRLPRFMKKAVGYFSSRDARQKREPVHPELNDRQLKLLDRYEDDIIEAIDIVDVGYPSRDLANPFENYKKRESPESLPR